jgi:DNA-binding CsgD family transcriptional regulator
MLEDLSLVIGQIYDAAVDPALWKAALAQIALFVGANRVTIAIEDAQGKKLPPIFTLDDDPAWLPSCFGAISLNPIRIKIAAYGKAGDIVLVTDLLTQQGYEKTLYHKDLLDDTVAIIDRTPGEFTLLAAHHKSELGPANQTVRARLALVTPHMARAVAIRRALERTKLEVFAFAEVLDRLAVAILLVDQSGRVVQANRSAREYLQTSAVLRTAQGILRMHDAKATAALDEAIASATDRAAPGAEVTIPLLSSSGERYFANVLPLNSGARSEIGDHFHAVAAIFVRRVGLDLPLDPMPVARSYGLTPRELTVMITVVESGRVPETAAVLGLSENTVRTHLQSIYRKTGARNQAELSRLVASAGNCLH